MAYIRKTEDEYQIHGNFGQGFEEVCAYDNRKDALADIKEYRASGIGIYKIVKRRVPKPPAPEPGTRRKLYEVHVWAGNDRQRFTYFSQSDLNLQLLQHQQAARRHTAQDGIERHVESHVIHVIDTYPEVQS
jgi:hypothetical protein